MAKPRLKWSFQINSDSKQFGDPEGPNRVRIKAGDGAWSPYGRVR